MGVHDVDKYDQIRELLGIREGEPIFILRAQDKIAVETIEFYSDTASASGCDPSFLEDLRQVENAFDDWAVKNSDKMKRPD